MTTVAAAVDGRALWYLTRGTGAVSLVLLTLSVVLGVADVRRWSAPRLPRFVVDGLHQTVSLLVIVTLAIHIATTLLDSFAPIRLVDVVVPFGSAYRPLWVGFGALAFDLLLALVITSLARARLGYRAWRAVHWLAYACWPVALLHGLGSGSDIRGGFAFVLSLACAAAVVVAVLARLHGKRRSQRVRSRRVWRLLPRRDGARAMAGWRSARARLGGSGGHPAGAAPRGAQAIGSADRSHAAGCGRKRRAAAHPHRESGGRAGQRGREPTWRGCAIRPLAAAGPAPSSSDRTRRSGTARRRRLAEPGAGRPRHRRESHSVHGAGLISARRGG